MNIEGAEPSNESTSTAEQENITKKEDESNDVCLPNKYIFPRSHSDDQIMIRDLLSKINEKDESLDQLEFDELKDLYDDEEEDIDGDDGHEYGSPSYWDDRYAISQEPFDWYQNWEQLEPVLGSLFVGDEDVLNIGCGNSEMSADMVKKTFKSVVSIDISFVVIKQMIEKYADFPNLIWFAMDCTKMEFEDQSFDVVFDKGTIDAILCGDNSITNTGLTLSEVWRILRPGGIFIEITYGRPENRVGTFKQFQLPWHLYHPLLLDNPEKPDGCHYIYIFQKTTSVISSSDDDDNGNVDQPSESSEQQQCSKEKSVNENENNSQVEINQESNQ